MRAWTYKYANDFNGFLAPQNLDKDTKFITLGQFHREIYGL